MIGLWIGIGRRRVGEQPRLLQPLPQSLSARAQIRDRIKKRRHRRLRLRRPDEAFAVPAGAWLAGRIDYRMRGALILKAGRSVRSCLDHWVIRAANWSLLIRPSSCS
jgi:hypothetical protein